MCGGRARLTTTTQLRWRWRWRGRLASRGWRRRRLRCDRRRRGGSRFGVVATARRYADSSGEPLHDMQRPAIQPGRVPRHRDGDHHRTDRPERGEQREPGQHAERREYRMPANVGRWGWGRRRGRRGNGGTVVC